MAGQRTVVPTRSTTIEPLLSVRRGAHAISFYVSAFSARVIMRVDAENGDVVARLTVANATFWVADESPAHQNFSPESLAGSTTRLILTVDDPLTVFDAAVAAGATVISPVAEDYGWLVGRVVDPFGHHWEIGRPISDDAQ